MKWDNLTMSQKQALMKIYVNNGVTNLDEIRNHYNRFDDGGFTDDGYYDWIEKLAAKKSKDWEMSEDETLTMMLNDNTYNYREFYNRNREDALKMLTADPNAHFNDIGKTVYHPTFSKYSAYSGKVSDYNPRGTKGGNWRGNEYIPSKDQIRKGDFNYDRTNKYLEGTGEYINSKYNRYAEGGPTNNTTENNTIMYSRTPRELASNIVNTRPVPGLITMTEVPRVGAGVNIPITEAINNIITRRSKVNTPTNVVSTDSIVTRIPVSYIGMPTRINRFDDGGYKVQSDNTRVQMPKTDVEPIKIPDEELKWMGWREQTYPDGETYMAPPLDTGALTPIYPEFEILTGFKGILNDKFIKNTAKKAIKPLTQDPTSVGDVLGFYQRKGFKNAFADSELQKAVDKIENTIDDVNDFYVEDVIPRMRKINDEKIVNSQKVEEMLDEITYNILDNKGDELGGFAIGDEIFIPKDPGIWDMDQIIAHENHHALRHKYGEKYTNQNKLYNKIAAQEDPKFRAKNAFGYTKKEQDLLDEAYSFTDDYLKNNDITPLFEKGATNTEIRRHISKKYNNVTGRKLDLIIDHLSDNDLLELLEEHNGYSRNFKKHYDSLSFLERITKLENMRAALKKVGEYGIPMYFTGEVLQNKEK